MAPGMAPAISPAITTATSTATIMISGAVLATLAPRLAAFGRKAF